MDIRKYKSPLLVIVICFIAFFVNNDVIVPDIMESRNIVTAREMVYDGHWIVPTMNGELRLEKPPLPTWLTAVAEMISPDNVALQRGVAGLAALLLCFYFWRFARRVLGIEPMVPLLLLCTCYSVVLMGRTASWDIYCHAFMMGCIYHLARGLQAEGSSWRQLTVAGVYAGLSIMSKGPVSLYALLLPFVISFVACRRPSVRGKGGALAVMVVTALVIGAWWYIYIRIGEAEALAYVVRKESGAWLGHNVRPWWYYWKFFLEAGVWSLLLLTAMFQPLFAGKHHRSGQWTFSLSWMLCSLLLLSLLPEKKSRYLLPILIPACYVMGLVVLRWIDDVRSGAGMPQADKWAFRINAGVIALAVAVLPVAGWYFLVVPGYMSIVALLLLTLFAVLLLFFLVRACVQLRPMDMVVGVTALFAVAECAVLPSLKSVINNPEMRSIAVTRTMPELRDVPFCHVDTVPLRIEMVYAAHRNIKPVALDTLAKAVPCVLLTHERLENMLPDSCLKGLTATEIGLFDDNRWPRTSKRYSREFIYWMYWLRAKG